MGKKVNSVAKKTCLNSTLHFSPFPTDLERKFALSKETFQLPISSGSLTVERKPMACPEKYKQRSN